MTNGSDLPHGWCWASLGELATNFLNGFGKRQQDCGTPAVVLRLADITDGAVSLASVRRVNATPNEVEKYQLSAGDLLAIRVNGSADLVGRLVRFTSAHEPILFCDHFVRVRPAEARLSRFLRLFADTPTFRQFIDSNKVCSAGQNTISQATLERLTVPLPPLDEQTRIVDRADELLSDLNAGVAALLRAQANLKKYRAAVLKAAVTGELTADWRAAHPDVEPASKLLDRILAERRQKWESDQLTKFAASGTLPKGWQERYTTPEEPDTTQLIDLPSGWGWATTEMLAKDEPNAICAGPFGTIFKAHDFRPEGVPIIFLRHVSEGRYLTHKPGFMDATKWEELFQPYSVYGGELLVTKLGDPPGVAAIYPEGVGPAMVTPDVIKLTADSRLADTRWVMHYLNSQVGKRVMFGAAFGTTRMRVTLPIFRSTAIPIPPRAEQEVAVAEIERYFSVIDATENYITASLKRAGRLRQSILKEAFAGRLVPQDPNDVPASVLLDHIRQSRAASGSETVGRRKKSARP